MGGQSRYTSVFLFSVIVEKAFTEKRQSGTFLQKLPPQMLGWLNLTPYCYLLVIKWSSDLCSHLCTMAAMVNIGVNYVQIVLHHMTLSLIDNSRSISYCQCATILC